MTETQANNAAVPAEEIEQAAVRKDRDEAERAYRRHHKTRLLVGSDTDNAWCAGYAARMADEAPNAPIASVPLSTYESVVRGRQVFRKSYLGALQLMKKFVDAWEGVPGHENMDRLCEMARNFKGVGETSPQPAMTVCESVGPYSGPEVAGQTIACPSCSKLVTLRMDIHGPQIPRHLTMSENARSTDEATLRLSDIPVELRCKHALPLTQPCADCESVSQEGGERIILLGPDGVLRRRVTVETSRPVFNHERDCGLTSETGVCECPQKGRWQGGDGFCAINLEGKHHLPAGDRYCNMCGAEWISA